MKLIETETERLRLRQWREEDGAAFAELNADPEVMRHFPAVLSREKSDLLADYCKHFIEENGWGFWAIETKEDNRFIGFTGLNRPDNVLPFSPCVEIGWRLAASSWGKGYATEAATEALRIGFEVLNFKEIVAYTAVSNVKSRAVMERIGLLNQNEDFHHPELPRDHPLSLHCLYKISTGKCADPLDAPGPRPAKSPNLQ